MVAINITRSERQTLDELVGRALLDEKLKKDLLRRDTRYSALCGCVLSPKVMQHLMSFDDRLDLADFADDLDQTISQ